MREWIESWLQAKRYKWKRYDVSLIVVVMLLSIISCYNFYLKDGGAFGSEFKHQLLGLFLGLVLLLVFSILDYHTLCTYVPILYIVGTLMAVATKFSPIGTDQNTGSFRWINLVVVKYQPSEICKIILILTLAVYFTKMRERLQSFKTFFLACAITMVPTFFILIQSDLSSSLVLIFILAMMILGSGIGWKIVTPVVGVITPLIIVFFWYIQQPGEKFLLKPYQVERIVGFLHPETEKLGIMYQQSNSIVSIASGKLYGKLMLEGPATSRNYSKVSVNESDFIWSIIGEEYGFIGCLIILALIGFIVVKCYRVAKHARDYEGMLIAVGIAAMFSFQTFFNIGVATSILPNTGLPLPFLSSGLSSLTSSMMAVGIIINIGIQPARAGGTNISLVSGNLGDYMK